MLKGIPSMLSPELLKILMEMGHGDEIVIGDGNFPGASHAAHLIRLDGHGVPEVLDAILQFLPLDKYVDKPAAVMAISPKDRDRVDPVIWKKYLEIIAERERPVVLDDVERFAFYERARKAYAVIMTGESAIYANIILKKGVVK